MRFAPLSSLRNVRISKVTERAFAAKLDAKPVASAVRHGVDEILAATVVGLLGFGVLMVYSSSTVQGKFQYHDPQYFLKHQAVYALAGLVALFGVSRIDYHHLYKFTYPVLALVGLLLIASIAGFGHRGGGATRWIQLGPIHVQPAEMAKLALVTWLAYSLAKKAEQVKNFSVGFLPHLLVAGLFMFFCMKQPDFGSAVVLLILTFTLLFVAGAKLGYILGAGMLAGVFGVLSIALKEYRMARYLAWSNMAMHKQDIAYQPFQSLMSFGSGQITGLGLGHGLQLLYLPEAHTDFISAIVGEEFGFVGITSLIFAYGVLVWRGVRIAYRSPDDYGTYLAIGISTLFGVQTIINLAMAMALMPTKGLTLPFMSYGGSSLLVNAAAVGVLLSISRQIDREKSLAEVETPRPPNVKKNETT